jgi:hypothetical protein
MWPRRDSPAHPRDLAKHPNNTVVGTAAMSPANQRGPYPDRFTTLEEGTA